MNAVKVHTILLVVVMLIAFQTWTRDPTARVDDAAGGVTVWQENADAITSVAYETPSRSLRLERRVEANTAAGGDETYLWGIALPKNTPDSAPMRQEFPIGDEGMAALDAIAPLRALRDLGVLGDADKEEYELTEPGRTLTVAFESGEKTLEFGGTVYGGPHRYAVDPVTSRGYVIANESIRGLEGGPATLQARQLHTYVADAVTRATVRTATNEREMTREMDGPFAVWSSPDTPAESDQTFANFMERLEQLSILAYVAHVRLDTLEFVVRLDFAGEGGDQLGYLEMYRGTPDEEGVAEYFVMTEVTRVPASVYRSFAERVAQDLADIF